MANDVSIRVTVNNATGPGLTSVTASLRGLNSSAASSSSSLDQLKSTALTLAPALLPIASSLAPIALQAGAAGIAVAAFGAAIIPQIKSLGEAAKAQSKYTETVGQYGATSDKGIKAQQDLVASMAAFPPATRTAALAFTVLTNQYKGWSDSLAGDTMPVATKAFAVLGGTVGHLSPLVKDSSTELSRMMTILAGGVQSSGFDKLIKEVDEFAHQGLQNATIGLLRFGEALHAGTGQSQIQSFMAYARANGPLVADTFKQVAEALVHLVEGASDVGVSMLTVVNVFAHLANSVPPEVIGDLLQLAVAIKAVKIASAGAGVISAIAAQVTAARTAAAGAAGPVTSLSASFGALSKSAKIAVAGTGIGLLIIALGSLSNAGKKTPPSVDAITTSLEKLADTGRVTGAAAQAWGKNLDGLAESLDTLVKPSGLDSFQQSLTHLIGMDSTPVKDAKDNIDSLDKALAGLVQNGHADIAAQALADLTEKLKGQGLTSKQVESQLDGYKQALADQAFEAKLAAQAQGLFGEQAAAVQKQLDAQKQSTDGLRQSIQALNDVQRSALGGMIGFEQAIDDAAKAARDNAGALSMSHGALDLNTQKARDAASALQDLATKTDEAAADARDSGASWTQVAGIYTQGRSNLMKYAEQMGLTKTQAQKLTNQILKMPNKTVLMKADASDLNVKIKAAQKTVDALKQKRKTAVGADKTQLDSQIKAAQAKVNSLKQKKAAAIKASNQAGSGTSAAQRAINSVHGKTVTITTRYVTNGGAQHAAGNPYFATGGITGGFGQAATGGPRSGFTLVGEQGPELVNLAAGSRVHSNPDTKRMLAGGTAGGPSQPIVVPIILDGRVLAQALIDPLSGEIRQRGGDVQRTLGGRRR